MAAACGSACALRPLVTPIRHASYGELVRVGETRGLIVGAAHAWRFAENRACGPRNSHFLTDERLDPHSAPPGTWTPTIDDVLAFESGLHRVLETYGAGEVSCDRTISVPEILRTWVRQYVGVIHEGRRQLRVDLARSGREDQWLSRKVEICDGGLWLVRVIWHPETRTYEAVEFHDGGCA